MTIEPQHIYYAVGVISVIITIWGTMAHAERKFEKRLVRIETFMMLVCHELKIPTSDINPGQ